MVTSRKNGSLYTFIENKTAVLEFGHPASNSLPSELLLRLASEFDKLSKDSNISVILLKSEGEKTFCSGAFFNELINIKTEKQGKIFFSGFANVINSMRCCSKIIIGHVQGKVVGGGIGLVAACDYALACEKSSIKLSELAIGIGPFVIAPVVKRKIGVGALSELTLNPSNWKNAYWAQEKGLYARVFDSVKNLDDEINLLTYKLSNYNPKALIEIKKSLWEGTEHWDKLLLKNAEISGKLILSTFTKEALKKIKK